MAERSKQICVFGGTGFIGQQIIRELAKLGYVIKIATRIPEKAFFLKTCGNVGQIVPFFCDYSKDDQILSAIKNCDIVINCIGILYEKKSGDFDKIHTNLLKRIAIACKTQNTDRFIHISALGCDKSLSKYGKSKLAGETAIFENYKTATILRPSVVFGADDNFFNMFAKLSVVSPFLPLIGGGNTKFQPVYVGDIANAVVCCLKTQESKGQIYELGGPEVLNFKQIYKHLFAHTGRERILLNLPWPVAKVQGHIMGILPNPMLTADQVLSLKTDTIVGQHSLGLKDLGISPTPMDTILPTYLKRFKPGGRFGDKKRFQKGSKV